MTTTYEVTVDNGTTTWRLNGLRHREDGPAVEYANGEKHWYLNGRRHREDGPAVEWANGYKLWWVNGIQLSDQEFRSRTTIKEMSIAEIEAILGHKIKVVKE